MSLFIYYMSSKENPQSLSKLITKVNTLLNELSILKSKNKELEKINSDLLDFLKELPKKNALHQKSMVLIEEVQLKMERLDKKKD
jgi:cell shape-determining protein MreC